MGIELILRFWRESLIALLLGCLMIQTMRLDSANHELEIIKIQTQAAKETSNATIEKLRESIPVMVSQAQTNAVANYKKRFGVACGLRPGGLLPYSGGEAGSSKGTNEASADAMADPAIELAKQCGETTALYNAWQEWAKSNDLKVK